MNEREKDRKRRGRQNSEWMNMIWGNPVFTDYVERNYLQDGKRMELLQEIFLAMDENRREETEQKIYLYGSMLREQDLMERQMFLWLLGIEAEKRGSRITKEEKR